MAGKIDSRGNGSGNGARASGWASLRKLMHLGVGVKRWMLLGAVGISICSVGLAFVIKNLFDLSLPDVLPWFLEGVLLGVAGVTVILLAVYGLYRSVGPLLLPALNINAMADTIYTRRYRERGPRIVAIGGGTGLSVLLRGLKTYSDNITVIVTVADDGGSSGRLRRELGVLPPGDFRNCLVAMSDDESLVGDLFQYRFDQGDGLEGHSFGNLFIAAMTDVTGSFERALYESSKVLAVHGSILPATTANLRLSARLVDGSLVQGESSITERGVAVDEIMIHPHSATAHRPAVEAIQEAQLIVVGPGSLYTSILPNLLVPGISEAIDRSKVKKVYVCNVATQLGETNAFSLADHVAALQKHTFPELVSYVIANDTSVDLGSEFLGQPVLDDGRPLANVHVVGRDLVDREHPVRHHSAALAQVVMDVYHGKVAGSAVEVAAPK